MRLSLILPLFLIAVSEGRFRRYERNEDDHEDAVDYSKLRSNLRQARPAQRPARQPEAAPEWMNRNLRKTETKNRDWEKDQMQELREDVFREFRGEEPVERNTYENFKQRSQKPRRRWNRETGRFEVS
ncbi:hypothetical protein PSACC_01978 [Paramicrosporidium saccamoebae]|uniref:Uncharacterized protein n=1 Tax=Paramicrosporidium saccamoebae TaxID=1246581 RepID=A0A2H9TKF0_9FUNG|nr:hypothetical protein PSACC_01978 [Paramicrosporidium saccamoebae]